MEIALLPSETDSQSASQHRPWIKQVLTLNQCNPRFSTPNNKQSMRYRNSINVWNSMFLQIYHDDVSTSLLWTYTAVPAVHESWLMLISHAANFLLDPGHVGLTLHRSVSPESDPREMTDSPCSSSRPLSFTCSFTAWRSCPQPVLVLGYLGKGKDPRIERTPLGRLFEPQKRNKAVDVSQKITIVKSLW